MEFVSWDYSSQYDGKVIIQPCSSHHQPVMLSRDHFAKPWPMEFDDSPMAMMRLNWWDMVWNLRSAWRLKNGKTIWNIMELNDYQWRISSTTWLIARGYRFGNLEHHFPTFWWFGTWSDFCQPLRILIFVLAWCMLRLEWSENHRKSWSLFFEGH